jgi:hypothetical protein
MPRKTVDVLHVVEYVNRHLRSPASTVESRNALRNLAEDVLMTSDNYRGYAYLDEKEVPAGELPGIRYTEEGSVIFDNVDRSRVRYFIHHLVK